MLKKLVISMYSPIITKSKQKYYKIDQKKKYATLSIDEERKKS